MEAHNMSDRTSEEVHARILSLKKEGKDHDAILAAEESLHRSVVSRGPLSEQTHGVAADLVLAYNHLAMKELSENNIKGSIVLLQKAKLLTSRDQPFLGNARLQARALTLNNLGCLMKKWGKPRESVKFLARALRIEAEVPGSADNPAGTHVNMSATLSTLGLHRAAATHASHAIDLASRAMMDQEAGSSFVAIEDGSTTMEGNASVADAGGVKEDDAALVELAATAQDGERIVEGGVDSGGSLAVVGFGECPDSARAARPVVAGTDGKTVDSAVVDDGHSAGGAPSSSAPIDGAGHEMPGHKEAGVYVSSADSSTEGQGLSPGDNKGVQGRTSSIERDKAPSSAAGGLLAIACFNLGVEREHLGQFSAAISSYKDARLAAEQHLGPENPVAKGIEIALKKASAAAVTAAFHSRKRAASRSRTAVSSFPCIGKLQFGQKTPDGVSSSRSGGLSSRCRLQPRQQLSEGTAGEATTARELLEQAYTTPRPYPAPPRTDSWAPLGHVSSPRSPPLARNVASGSASGGPQRAGRWTSTHAPVARLVKQAQRSGGWRTSGQCVIDEDLRWRALACAEWHCSPREALHAQKHVPKRQVNFEAAGDITQRMTSSRP